MKFPVLWSSITHSVLGAPVNTTCYIEKIVNCVENALYKCITIKDGAYYCYCAYVLRISRYSDFLSPMLTNTGIFLRGLKLSGESRS